MNHEAHATGKLATIEARAALRMNSETDLPFLADNPGLPLDLLDHTASNLQTSSAVCQEQKSLN
jgi:hypothetical protein